MRTRTSCGIFVAGLFLLACSSGGSSSSTGTGGPGTGTSAGDGGSAAGVTFCAVAVTKVVTCPSPASQDTRVTSICKENVSNCKSILPVPDSTSEKEGSCDVDTRYRISDKNTSGPRPGTCAQYDRWNNGQDECLDDADCGSAGLTCRAGLCHCGETRWDRSERGKGPSLPSACDGDRIIFPAFHRCENGVVLTDGFTPGDDCAATKRKCVPVSYGAACQ